MSSHRVRLAAIALALAAGCSSEGSSGTEPQPVAAPVNDAAAAPQPQPAAGPDAGPAFEHLAKVPGQHWDAEQRATAIAAGVKVMEKHQCTRCHQIDGQPTAGRAYECTPCHQFLKNLPNDKRRYDKIAAKNGKDVVDRYIRNIEHLLVVPDLSGIGKRIRPEWIATYLAQPYDLRPTMPESMIRNKVTAEEAAHLVRYFAAVADVPDPTATDVVPALPPAPPPQRIADGRAKFIAYGCAACHTFGNADLGTKAEDLVKNKLTNQLAPNLRFARERMAPETVVAWILDPLGMKPTTTMPKLGLPRADAELMRDFILYGDPGSLPPAPEVDLTLPPAVARQVGWAEVKERVLGKVCVHCHMNDHEKDTGPGNLGGLGFTGVGLSFRTYERSVWGAKDPKTGKRYSVFVPRKGEKIAPVLASMLRRRVEHLRDMVDPLADHQRPEFADARPGMPMGLPSMTDEEFGILRAWIEQGCPGPAEVTGKPGFTDGFLVPDGPIKVNKGCQLRKPAKKPPAWAAAHGGG